MLLSTITAGITGNSRTGGIDSDDPRDKSKPKANHQNNDAKRYLSKMFLLDLHLFWRVMVGEEPSVSFHEGKLGHVHHNYKEEKTA